MKNTGLAVAVLAVVAVGFLSWYLLGSHNRNSNDANQDIMAYGSLDDSAGLGFGADTDVPLASARRARDSDVRVVNYAPPPVWATRDIHEVPLGTILDYAVEVVQYDDDRARGTSLPKNRRGQGPFVTITPAEGVWGMSRATLSEGHIVAKIESDGDYLDLGIVSGLNVLWVGNDPNGKLEWVLVPGTAFAPLTDLSETEARGIFRQHDELSNIPVQIRDF